MGKQQRSEWIARQQQMNMGMGGMFNDPYDMGMGGFQNPRQFNPQPSYNQNSNTNNNSNPNPDAMSEEDLKRMQERMLREEQDKQYQEMIDQQLREEQEKQEELERI